MDKLSTVHKPKYPVQTLEKALEIIEVMYKEGVGGLGISELDNKLGIGKSTIHRILDTLMAYNYVEKCAESTKYRLSWKFFEIGNLIPQQRNLSNLNMEDLQELCNKYEETVNLGVRVDDSVVIISRIDPKSTLVANVPIGTREPLHATGMGKVILSELSKEELIRIFGDSPLKSCTPNTISSLDDLMIQLDKIREQGYSIDDEEFYPGLSCIAMPIRNYKREIVAAVSVSGPSMRLNFTKIMNIKKDLEKTCNILSNYLGYNENAANE
ncbi:IclR family transcriptional regulator [Geosporobacter ferrireducens]|uniref:IclR family transcriptional regulator n=1 Tax=Geosporobacter ferrireducens TaxID=1424294 RepID=A0A1D8GCT2_9FIRM|nr:IclR family transcriptional regulator [Geosporobacter ferrireducens]AOT68710.1 IclR family transcriptional regulator [Geosporobacter ferrireducens]MTI57598.1 IclR family transcriptional regulator [Geosporobacter ferrireducens]